MKSFKCDELSVSVCKSAEDMAHVAADQFVMSFSETLIRKDTVNVIFSGAESQQLFHREIARRAGIDWSRINAFSVDEFCARDLNPECLVSAQPQRDLFGQVTLKSVNKIDGLTNDLESERSRYAKLLEQNPPDIACLGIGRSGHIALNEPNDCDFDDPENARIVKVHPLTVEQLTVDPNFMAVGTIPEYGISLTLPLLMSAKHILTLVPYRSKADAIKTFFASSFGVECPATILKKQPHAKLYLDEESFAMAAEGLLQEVL